LRESVFREGSELWRYVETEFFAMFMGVVYVWKVEIELHETLIVLWVIEKEMWK
jgi:hypothetical protein